jgi:hypothetical protein
VTIRRWLGHRVPGAQDIMKNAVSPILQARSAVQVRI